MNRIHRIGTASILSTPILPWYVSAVFALEFQATCTKIDQQADFNCGGSEVVNKLHLVGAVECLHGFVFHKNKVFDEHIGREVADN